MRVLDKLKLESCYNDRLAQQVEWQTVHWLSIMNKRYKYSNLWSTCFTLNNISCKQLVRDNLSIYHGFGMCNRIKPVYIVRYQMVLYKKNSFLPPLVFL